MAQRQSAQKRGILGDIDDWISQRNAQAGQFARDAETKGRQIWEDWTPGELRALGADKLQQVQAPAATSGAGDTHTKANPDQGLNPLGEEAAALAGNVAGVARGIVHSVQGAHDTVQFVSRLADPTDTSTKHQALRAADSAVDYVAKALKNPAMVAGDLGKFSHQLYFDTVPSATPEASTFPGELRRNFDLGKNQGELAWDIGSLLFGTGASKPLARLSSAAKGRSPAKFVSQGFTPAQAEYLAEPYVGDGHHYVPRSVANTAGIPQAIQDSIFNVFKPNVSRGDFYEGHFKSDPDFYAARLPGNVGGGTWNGKTLGLQKYGVLGRIWHGSPAPLNAAVGLAGLASLPESPVAKDAPQ